MARSLGLSYAYFEFCWFLSLAANLRWEVIGRDAADHVTTTREEIETPLSPFASHDRTHDQRDRALQGLTTRPSRALRTTLDLNDRHRTRSARLQDGTVVAVGCEIAALDKSEHAFEVVAVAVKEARWRFRDAVTSSDGEHVLNEPSPDG